MQSVQHKPKEEDEYFVSFISNQNPILVMQIRSIERNDIPPSTRTRGSKYDEVYTLLRNGENVSIEITPDVKKASLRASLTRIFGAKAIEMREADGHLYIFHREEEAA